MNGFLHHIVLNGDLVEATAARISPLGDGFSYGLGVFETVRVLRGRPVFFVDHFARLQRSARELGLAFATTAGELGGRCVRCLAANQLEDGGLKIAVFQDAAGIGELISARAAAYLPVHYEKGFALKTFSTSRHDDGLSRLKTLNYLENLRARRAAQAAGGDEALFVGADRRVLEGAASNVFVVKGGKIFTPPADGRILPGIARGQVLGILEVGRAHESAIEASALFEAEEIFVTSALLGVMPVAAVDEKRYDLTRNPVTRALMAAVRLRQLESVEKTV